MIPQLDTSYFVSQIVWLVFCITTLVIFFKKVFLPKITRIVSARDSEISKLNLIVKKLSTQHNSLSKEIANLYEKQNVEAQKILNEAKLRCDRILDEQTQQLQNENARAIKQLRQKADDVLKNIDNTMDVQIEEISQQLFDKLFGEK